MCYVEEGNIFTLVGMSWSGEWYEEEYDKGTNYWYVCWYRKEDI
jgi:hypothetical protein